MVAFDATVLCRALLNPSGVEFELLVRAAQGFPFRGFTTEVVGMEFLRNAYMGFGAGDHFRTYEPDELEEFLDTFAPLFAVGKIRASPLGERVRSAPRAGRRPRRCGCALHVEHDRLQHGQHRHVRIATPANLADDYGLR